MNLADILPEVGTTNGAHTLWLHGPYGDPKRANFWDLRAMLLALTPEQLTEIVESARALSPRTSCPSCEPGKPPLDLVSALSSFFCDWGVVKGLRKGDVPRVSDVEELIAIFRRHWGPRAEPLPRVKRSRFARSRTKRRLDQLASALSRLASFANVSHTLEREALKGEVRPSDVATWIEQALASDWKRVFKLTGTTNIPDAVQAIRSNVTARKEYVRGQTEMQERAASEAATASCLQTAKRIRELPLAIEYDQPGPVADVKTRTGPCGHCGGSGIVAENEYQAGPCPECGGVGAVSLGVPVSGSGPLAEALTLVNEARSLLFDAQVTGHRDSEANALNRKIESWCERAQVLDILHGDSGGSGAAKADEKGTVEELF